MKVKMHLSNNITLFLFFFEKNYYNSLNANLLEVLYQHYRLQEKLQFKFQLKVITYNIIIKI